MGRPLKKIDGKIVQSMARFGASKRSIAVELGCDEATIRNRFSAEYDKGRSTLINRIARKQIALAEKGNVALLIFLGKQLLGQSDKTEITGADGGPLQIQQKPAFDWDAYRAECDRFREEQRTTPANSN